MNAGGSRAPTTAASPRSSTSAAGCASPRSTRPGTSTRLPRVEDYTSRYKGEAVEIALFGGEYQDGILTAYCLIEDVAHVELNGHILVPLQNVASLHCTSRCDAQDDWPPRGRFDDERDEGEDEGSG